MFSAAVFRDSKAFGKVKAAVARIPRKVNADEDLTDAETLEKFGILEAGADFRIAGPVSLRTDRGVLDVSVVREGLALPSSAVKDARVETVRTEILLSVENLAVFRECARRGVAEKCVLVYSGGLYSRRRMAMLGRVAAAMGKDAKLCHWGDMDLGGVMIFRHIKENCLPGVKPWLMSAEVLERYADRCEPVSREYADKVARLAGHPALEEFNGAISMMAKRMVWLEQETILCSEPGLVPIPGDC